ncbi:MAG: ElyC/SanA/YdcF family protein [bacterium]
MRNRLKPVVALLAALCGLFLFTNVWMLRSTQSQVFKMTSVPARTWAIVPGARVWASGEPSHSLEDRLQTALDLYQQGKVKRILVSGDHGHHSYNEVQVMHDWLHQRGVPSADIDIDHAGFRTLDTMARAEPVFGVKDAIICTQRFHLYRALYLADARSLDVVGVPSDRRVYQGELWNQMRESLARVVAVLDVSLGREAKFPT